MRIWRLAFIAAVAGFIYGVTSSEPPFSHLQKAALSITRLPMSWWANRMANGGHLTLAKHRKTVVPHPGSENTKSIISAAHKKLDATENRLLDAEINEPTDWKGDVETKGEMAGVLVTENLLSVNAKNLSLSSLLEDLSKKCDIEILGKDAPCDKVISAKFDSMKLEDGIRQLMRVAGIENYALSYRIAAEDQCAVSQIILFPEDSAVSENQHFAKPQQEAGSQVTDHRQAELIKELATGVPEEIPADVRAEIQEEVPAEMQAGILAEMQAELRNQMLGQSE